MFSISATLIYSIAILLIKPIACNVVDAAETGAPTASTVTESPDGNAIAGEEFKLKYTITGRQIDFAIDDMHEVARLKYSLINETDDTLWSRYSNESLSISSLEPCARYLIEAEVLEKGDATESPIGTAFNYSIIIKMDYQEPMTELISVIPFNDSIALFWSSNNTACIARYNLELTAPQYLFQTNVTHLETDVTVEDLIPCNNYTLTLQTIDINGMVVSLIVNDIQTAEVDPNAVDHVLISFNESIAEITWNQPVYAPTCVNKYLVEVTPKDCANCPTQYFMQMPNETHVMLEELEACETYVALVYTNNVDEWAKRSSDEFSGNFAVPGPITNLAAEIISATEVEITWDAPLSNALCVKKYQIHVNGQFQYDATNTSILLEHLEPCGEYTVRVYVVDMNDTLSEECEEIEVQTLESIPTGVTKYTTEPSGNDLYVAWSKPENSSLCVKHYRIVVWINGIPDVHVNDTTTNNTYVNLRGLKNCVTYTTQVIPVTYGSNDGQSVMFDAEMPSKVPDTPSYIRSSDITHNSFVLRSMYNESLNACPLRYAAFSCQLNSTDPGEMISMFLGVKEQEVSFSVLMDRLVFGSYVCSIRIQNTAGWSQEISGLFQTAEDFPSEPKNLTFTVLGPDSVSIDWERPLFPNGQISFYKLFLMTSRPMYGIPKTCTGFSYGNSSIIVDTLGYVLLELKPFVEYTLQVAAQNGAGISGYSAPVIFTTKPTVPETVADFKIKGIGGPAIAGVYNSSITFEWSLPCRSNGLVKEFFGKFVGTREFYDDHIFQWNLLVTDPDLVTFTKEIAELRPQFNYNFTIAAVVNGVPTSSVATVLSFQSPAGIPAIANVSDVGSVDAFSSQDPTTTAKVVISRDMLRSDMGDIAYVAILLSQRDCQKDPIPEYRLFNSSYNWPIIPNWNDVSDQDCIRQYQTTPLRWNPGTQVQHLESDQIEYVIGQEKCQTHSLFCNGPLRPGTSYAMVVRSFTSSGYSDSQLLIFKTDDVIRIYFIMTIIVSILFAAVVIGIFILWRSKMISWKANDFIPTTDEITGDIAIKNFPTYYSDLLKNQKLSKEFKELTEMTKDINYSSIEAKTNDTKNRYNNIYPYDRNRVILNFRRGDDDYINASYINGYKRQREYIATQGPKPETCNDFWRMILQCKVSIIVMLTPLKEGDKVKCHRYYPLLDEQLQFNDINIKCVKETKHDCCERREFDVMRNETCSQVVQFHFNKWPDHDCPKNPNDLIDFVKLVRYDHKNNKPLPLVVHCSAGVGRTGTFIALDIIIQKIKHEKKINIFEIVKELRHQRLKMVQTYPQYNLLYKCTLQLIKNKYKLGKTIEDNTDDCDAVIKDQNNVSQVYSYVPDDIESSM